MKVESLCRRTKVLHAPIHYDTAWWHAITPLISYEPFLQKKNLRIATEYKYLTNPNHVLYTSHYFLTRLLEPNRCSIISSMSVYRIGHSRSCWEVGTGRRVSGVNSKDYRIRLWEHNLAGTGWNVGLRWNEVDSSHLRVDPI